MKFSLPGTGADAGQAGSAGGAAALLAERGPLIVSLLLAVAIAALAAKIVLGLLSAPRTGGDSGGAAVVNMALPAFSGGPPAGAVDANLIAAAHLFGQAAAAGNAAGAPQTTAALVLAGTIAYNDPELGYAILGESAQAGRMYKVGATVPGGATLHSVYADRVILSRNGALETLALPRSLLPGMPPPRAPAGLAAGGSAPNAVVDTVRRAIAQDPNVVAEVIRPTPVLMDGQLKGFRVYPGRDRARFAALGLQPGDLITQVNGNDLNDPAAGLQALQGLAPGDQVNVTITRNGVTRQQMISASQMSGVMTPPGAPPGATGATAQPEQ